MSVIWKHRSGKLEWSLALAYMLYLHKLHLLYILKKYLEN